MNEQDRRESLGPAERIINAMTIHADHMVHNRPGVVVKDESNVTGVRWFPVVWKVDEEGRKGVHRLDKIGRGKTRRTLIGFLGDDGIVRDAANREVGSYRKSGIFPEVAKYMYEQVAAVWALDNEFAARWASYAFQQKHRDMKTLLAAFMMVQSRKGDPVVENGEVLFRDDDFRDVGEAMTLLYGKGIEGLNPRLLLRIRDLLLLPEIVEINRKLGFGNSIRKPFLGRWPAAVKKWLRYREDNPQLLAGLVKAGFRHTVMSLCRFAHYKPQNEKFFETLRWNQKQSEEGHRSMALGKKVEKAETLDGKSEIEVCQWIEKNRPSYKQVTGMIPKDVGLTRAIMAATIEVGGLSNKDLIMATPTLEELGLLEVQDIRQRWQAAVDKAEDQRSRHIAENIKSKETREKLEDAADKALQKEVEEVLKDFRVYFMVDVSGSMSNAITEAKRYVAQLVQAFPLDRIHVAVFNTSGREVQIKHASQKGVENAFKSISAGGGTDYGAGVRALRKYQPKNDEESLFIFVGDSLASSFTRQVRESGLRPAAFGFVRIKDGYFAMHDGRAVEQTAADLGIPCFLLERSTFDDAYAIPRTLRNLIASTPVGQMPASAVPRITLVDEILQTDLLAKPAWALVA